MLNIFTSFKEVFCAIITDIAHQNNINLSQDELNRFTAEPTKDNSHGDLACNVAMVLVKKFKEIKNLNNPRALATKIVEDLNVNLGKYNIKKLEIAGPGFINIYLEQKIFAKIITSLLIQEEFSFPNIGKNEKINLEYASPNPTGPIHIGHTRGAIYGDVLANLLKKVGYDVLKEYYINDAGAQITTLLKSAYIRYLQACGQDAEISQGLYPGDYLIAIGQKIKDEFGENLLNKNEEEILPQIRSMVVSQMVELIKEDLLALGIKHDSYFSEKENLHDKKKIDEAIEILRAKDLIYEGKLEIPKAKKGLGAENAKLPEGFDEKDQTLFRSSKFGDDQDRVVKKHDGSPTYFAGDIAYSLSKFNRGATKFIMPLGYDHAGYVKRLSAAVEALSDGKASLKIILCQMVKFIKNGQPLKMSKRAGDFITARQVIDEVGADALRFIMLTRKNDAHFDFDLAKVVEASKDNPIFYVQYAHARCCSVLRNLENENLNFDAKIENIGDNEDLLNLLTDESEIELIKKIANFPRIIEMAVVNFEPHRIAFYLQELAALFHSLWNKGNDNPELKFIISDNLNVTKARIFLILALKKVISCSLDIFNIKAIEQMR